MSEIATMKAKPKAKPKKKDAPPEETISVDEAVNGFIGKVNNLLKIEICKVHEDKYRVNVWICYEGENMFFKSCKISQSYFMQFKDGELTDLTKPRIENKKSLF